jgi:hypothetical protein
MVVDRGEDYIYSVCTCCRFLACMEEHIDDSINVNPDPSISLAFFNTKTCDFSVWLVLSLVYRPFTKYEQLDRSLTTIR